MIASKSSRFLASMIDRFVVSFLASLVQDNNTNIALKLIPLLYFFFADSLPHGQSIGKKILKIAVISINTQKSCNIFQSFLRNLAWVLPFVPILECLAVLLEDDRRRIGDKWARTIVVRRRSSD